MNVESIERLKYLCSEIPERLQKINEDDFSYKPGSDKWNKKEVLGHLIDSATNNHHRFVRAQFEVNPSIVYDQNNWNMFSFYNAYTSKDLIGFWKIYNQHIIHLIEHLSEQSSERLCNNETLAMIFDDYVSHLEHHLKQIVNY